ncbi:MAG TPA: hypothetical protein VG709_04890 [Actinomycetota bacterium]|nr:hypothetical protein [Actinomycetota bacterium]
MIAAFVTLEIGFLIFVGAMTGLAGLFALYVLIQHFRNPSRR